jgi:hypothetical protein
MYVTAKMSALDGTWNEQLKSEQAFVRAVKHLAKANVLAIQAILKEQPDAVFVNSESGEFFQACCPDKEVVETTQFENERRFLALDLLYAVPPSPRVRKYLVEHGMTNSEFNWFMNQRISDHCILGIDYYEWNEKLINSDRQPEALGELFFLVRHHKAVLRPLPPSTHAHRDQLPGRQEGTSIALAAVAQRPAHAQRRRSCCRLHLVQPDRPG